MQQGRGENRGMGRKMMRGHYKMLALNLILSAVVMYLAMFTMIWSFADFFNNLNMLYMALIMWAPMGVLMLVTMASMYADTRLNLLLYATFAIVLVLSLFAMREQFLVGDRQFLRAMIPHHSGAILMCERASIQNPQVRDLCFRRNGIIQSQSREIKEMKGILEGL